MKKTDEDLQKTLESFRWHKKSKEYTQCTGYISVAHGVLQEHS